MAAKKDIDALIASVQSKYGASSIMRGEDAAPLVRTATGLLDLDILLDGGVPHGKILTVVGQYKSGKTTLALTLAKCLGPCLFIDTDRKYTHDYATLLGYTEKQVIVVRPDTLEDMFSMVFEALNYPLGSIVLDSLPTLIPTKERENKTIGKVTSVSPIAGLMSKLLPIVVAKISQTGAVFIIVNQHRDKINAMPFQNPFGFPGGHQLKALTTLQLTCAVKGQLKDDKIGNFGVTYAVMTEKNSLGPPMQRVELNYVYEKGYVGNILEARNQLLLDSGKKVRQSTLDKAVYIEEVCEGSEEEGE